MAHIQGHDVHSITIRGENFQKGVSVKGVVIIRLPLAEVEEAKMSALEAAKRHDFPFLKELNLSNFKILQVRSVSVP